MKTLDLDKQDMTVSYGNRTFAVRAYRQDGTWRGIIIEGKTPLRASLAPAIDAASCFAAAVHTLALMVDAGSVAGR